MHNLVAETVNTASVIITDWDSISDECDYRDIDAVAAAGGIRISRAKDILLVALDKVTNKIVGATWSSFDRDSEAEGESGYDEVYAFDFDIAVLPEYRVGGIGTKLIDETLAYYNSVKGDYPGYTYIKMLVINPKLAQTLENKYGFTLEADYGHDHFRMVRYD